MVLMNMVEIDDGKGLAVDPCRWPEIVVALYRVNMAVEFHEPQKESVVVSDSSVSKDWLLCTVAVVMLALEDWRASVSV